MISAVVILLAAAAVVSFLVYQQGMVLAKDFYIVGVSPSAPEFHDQRFKIIKIDPKEASAMLQSHKIDIYVATKALFIVMTSARNVQPGQSKLTLRSANSPYR